MWTAISFWLLTAIIALTGVAMLGKVKKADLASFVANLIQQAVFVLALLVLAGVLH